MTCICLTSVKCAFGYSSPTSLFAECESEEMNAFALFGIWLMIN